jgi:MFS family permease
MVYLRFFLAHPRVLSFGVLLTLFSSFGQTFLISIFVPRLLEALILAGVSQGVAGPMMTALWAEVYGVESLGATKGTVSTFGIIATALGPVLLGGLLKAGVSFGVIIPATALFGVLAIGTSLLARFVLHQKPCDTLHPSPRAH